ncbi:hypothetical protein H2200_001938 [Cladophialophora chaetospira]|uniref:Cytochrome P450 n=1 Tax=Cladophialophora chaetospira TaxID=386627 RepID=A0AA38XLX0_9EURO|nr:hypothetical protein H2200_001938 [Cladophialophora chaetospira]
MYCATDCSLSLSEKASCSSFQLRSTLNNTIPDHGTMISIFEDHAYHLLFGKPELACFIFGVTTHLILFRQGEWDLSTVRLCCSYLGLFLVTLLGSFYVNVRDDGPTFLSSIIAGANACSLAIAHFLGVFGSMSIYRLFFHRLSSFPGPFWGRLTGFYMSHLTRRRWHRFEETQRLHQKYGDFVRVGPQSLSITHPDATRALYAANTICSKGPFYDMTQPRETIFMTRSKKFHSKHRKDWDRAFSANALRDYEPHVTAYAQKLVDTIGSHVGNPLDVTRWFNFFSFDLMGELAFGESFGRLDAGQENTYMTVFHELMNLIGLLGSVPWLMHLVSKIPTTTGKEFQIYSRGLVEKRRKMPKDRRDIFSYLLDAYEKEPIKTEQLTETLYGDCDTIVVAGSDNTASSLAGVFYFLAKHPDHVEKLRAEFKTLPEGSSRFDARKLKDLPHLNAVINESARLLPAIASGVPRYTPVEGLRIGDKWIPGHVNVQVPSYTMFRGLAPEPKV